MPNDRKNTRIPHFGPEAQSQGDSKKRPSLPAPQKHVKSRQKACERRQQPVVQVGSVCFFGLLGPKFRIHVPSTYKRHISHVRGRWRSQIPCSTGTLPLVGMITLLNKGVFAYIYIHVYIYIRMYVYMILCVYIYICRRRTCIYVYMYLHICIHRHRVGAMQDICYLCCMGLLRLPN